MKVGNGFFFPLVQSPSAVLLFLSDLAHHAGLISDFF